MHYEIDIGETLADKGTSAKVWPSAEEVCESPMGDLTLMENNEGVIGKSLTNEGASV